MDPDMFVSQQFIYIGRAGSCQYWPDCRVGQYRKSRTEYYSVLPDLKSAKIYSLYDPALATLINGPGSSLGQKW